MSSRNADVTWHNLELHVIWECEAAWVRPDTALTIHGWGRHGADMT